MDGRMVYTIRRCMLIYMDLKQVREHLRLVMKVIGSLVAGGTDTLKSGTHIDPNIHCDTRVNDKNETVFTYMIHLYIDRDEKNDTLFVTFSDSRVKGDSGEEGGHVSYQKPERALTIFWR